MQKTMTIPKSGFHHQASAFPDFENVCDFAMILRHSMEKYAENRRQSAMAKPTYDSIVGVVGINK